ncbi:MAG: pantoate--beta-alanine ligase [Bdellovibrionota bacterium]
MAAKIRIVESIAELRAAIDSKGSPSVGFVPTMGALHVGHASLVERARAENGTVIVSVFVNPTQFNDPQDLERYPRTREADIILLEKSGADIVWFPRYDEIYADKYRYQIHENELSLVLCGKSRPGHFTGMLTVVLKLLQIVRATKTYFGEKDYQQLELVRGLATTFFVATEIVGCAISRDDQGLALSSRNARLGPAGLETARAFAKELAVTSRSLEDLRISLAKLPLEIDYLEDRSGRRYAAIFVEGVRLIDNCELKKENHS